MKYYSSELDTELPYDAIDYDQMTVGGIRTEKINKERLIKKNYLEFSPFDKFSIGAGIMAYGIGLYAVLQHNDMGYSAIYAGTMSIMFPFFKNKRNLEEKVQGEQ